MTEIKIEKKKQGWPWLLVALMIVFILVYLVLKNNFIDKPDSTISEETFNEGINSKNLLDVKENNRSVEAYVSFIKEDSGKVSVDFAYTKEAFLKLTTASKAMAEEIGYNIQADLEMLTESVKLINDELFETSLANNIRNAADYSALALQNMQLARYSWLTEEVNELKSASTAIQPEVLISQQKDAIINYFEKASDLLEKMN